MLQLCLGFDTLTIKCMPPYTYNGGECHIGIFYWNCIPSGEYSAQNWTMILNWNVSLSTTNQSIHIISKTSKVFKTLLGSLSIDPLNKQDAWDRTRKSPLVNQHKIQLRLMGVHHQSYICSHLCCFLRTIQITQFQLYNITLSPNSTSITLIYWNHNSDEIPSNSFCMRVLSYKALVA